MIMMPIQHKANKVVWKMKMGSYVTNKRQKDSPKDCYCFSQQG